MTDQTGAGTPARIPLCEPHLGGNAWTYVRECLDTNWVSSVGRFVDRFEEALAACAGVPHAVATVNGTAALHVALRVAGVEPDDEVLVSTLTFIAPANAVRYVGAHPVFVDAEPEHWQMDVAQVERFLGEQCAWRDGRLVNRATARRVRALLPVHVLGHPVDMAPLLALADRYGLLVIEDATESLGAAYRGRPVGSLGHLACFSFNGNKLLTTGGGGMLVTADARLAARARHLTTQAKADPLEYVHDEIGYNYRLTNLQAALGVAQVEQVEGHLRAKRRIAERYQRELGAIPGLSAMREAAWATSAWWLYTVRITPDAFGCDARALLRALDAHGIQSRPLWQPLHQSPAHAPGVRAGPCAVAERLHAEALSLPCSVGLTVEQQATVIDAIRTLAAGAVAPVDRAPSMIVLPPPRVSASGVTQ